MIKNKEIPIVENIQATTAGDLAPQVATIPSSYKLPTSPVVNEMLKLLSLKDYTKKELKQLQERSKNINHGQTMTVAQRDNERLVKISSQNYEATIILTDIDKLLGSNKTAKKLFIYNLIKLNDQAYSGGQFKRDYIQYSLQELVDIGFYSNVRSARTGFKNGMNSLTSIKTEGQLKKGKKEVSSSLLVLFTGSTIKNGICTVYINDRVNWEFIAAFYTLIPHYSFKLSNRAFDLMWYISYLARQNIRSIEEKGSFNLGLRAIQNRLMLPDEVGCINPTRDIKKPIEDAIKEIANYNKAGELIIEPIVNNNDSMTSYLDNGYLKVSLKGGYARDFILLSKNIKKRIETSKKRRESIVDKAKAINLAKKIETQKAIEEKKKDQK